MNKLKKENQAKLFETTVEVDQIGGKTELRLQGRGIVSTRTLITVISLIILVGLTLLAQVSSLGGTLLEIIKGFLSM